MITHIVMWRLKAENKRENALAMKEKLEALQATVTELLSIRVDFNSEAADAANFDVILTTTFSSFDDLAGYAKHPAHLAVVDFVKSVVTERVAIDY